MHTILIPHILSVGYVFTYILIHTQFICIGKIRVYIRLRPLSKSEIERGCTEATAKDGMSDRI